MPIIKNNKIDHPDYYNAGIETIDYIDSHNLKGCVIKYVTRARIKDNGIEIEDLKKAMWYLEREIRRLEVNE